MSTARLGRAMLPEAVGFLTCPHCGDSLSLDGRVVRCRADHAFDVARQGYVNLLPGGARPGTADTAAMVAAREAFFAAGHFAPLIRSVVSAAAGLLAAGPPGCIVDLGAGPGAYLAAVLDGLPGRVGLALDLSKHVARRAARCHPRAAAVICDVWRGMPVRSGSAALVLNVFAPRNGDEMARALAPGGAAVVVTPTTDHLREVVLALGLLTVDEHKRERVERQLASHLVLEREAPLAFTMSLDTVSLRLLVAMGPSAWHVDPARVRARIDGLRPPLTVTASVTVSRYRRRG